MAQKVNDVPLSVAVNYPQKPVYLPIELVQHKVAHLFTLVLFYVPLIPFFLVRP